MSFTPDNRSVASVSANRISVAPIGKGSVKTIDFSDDEYERGDIVPGRAVLMAQHELTEVAAWPIR